ncbi:MAG: glycoside hydrolase family 25 protein [Acidobacteriota bacterium]
MSSFPLGIDVSHHNGVIDWSAAAKAGIAFAYAKATEGATFTDKRFAANWKAIREAGLARGAYHFFHPATAVAKQVEHFVATVGELEPDDLPPMLDLEETSATKTKDEWRRIERAQRVPLALEWLERVEEKLGRRPLVYTRRGFVQDTLGAPGRLCGYQVWIAHYTKAAKPSVPPGWAKWTLWQYTDAGSLAGIKCKLDMNRLNGSLQDLLATEADAATAG